MPIYDRVKKIVYTDDNNIAFMPFVICDNKQYFFKQYFFSDKKFLRIKINSLEDLFLHYKENGISVCSLSGSLIELGVEIYEISKSSCIIDNKLVTNDSKNNKPLTFAIVAKGLGLTQYNNQFGAIKKRYGFTDLEAFIYLFKNPLDKKVNKRLNLKREYKNGVVTRELYRDRVKRGWDIEKALTTPKQEAHKSTLKLSVDHLGNKFESVKAMIEYWGISKQMYYKRKRKGWTLEEILTKPRQY